MSLLKLIVPSVVGVMFAPGFVESAGPGPHPDTRIMSTKPQTADRPPHAIPEK
jgi:hypothetical protein